MWFDIRNSARFPECHREHKTSDSLRPDRDRADKVTLPFIPPLIEQPAFSVPRAGERLIIFGVGRVAEKM